MGVKAVYRTLILVILLSTEFVVAENYNAWLE